MLMTPLPCRGGVGVGSVFFIHTQYLLYISILFSLYHRPHPWPLPCMGGETSRMAPFGTLFQ